MPTSIQVRLAQRAAAGVRCEVPACSLFVDRIGRYCDAHGKRDERNGHPTAAAVSKGELRPLVEQCAQFIAAQRDHAGIRAALDWLAAVLAAGRPVAPWRVHRKTMAGERVSAWMAAHAADGVEPAQILATVIALYLLQEQRPHRFAGSDRFFRHQLAIRVLRLGRGTWVCNGPAGRGTTWRHRVTSGTRETLSVLLVGTLGTLSIQAARSMERRRTEPLPRLPGEHHPFAGRLMP
jgi:hypothetical protein